MDLGNDPWQRAAHMLNASSDVWSSGAFAEVFPDGVEKVASAIVYTIGTDEVQWIETRADLEAPKVEAAIFAGSRIVHTMLTGHGFGFEMRRLTVTGLRATSTPYVHPTPGSDPLPFRFTADFDGLQVEFPWDPSNTKQDADLHEQFQRLLTLLV
jgi:hypothetical protein